MKFLIAFLFVGISMASLADESPIGKPESALVANEAEVVIHRYTCRGVDAIQSAIHGAHVTSGTNLTSVRCTLGQQL